MAKFAGENLGAKKAAVLFDVGNDYSKGLAESFKANFGNFGGEVVAYESYSKDDQDFKALLTNIKGAKPDVLFVTDYYDKAALIAKQVKETKLNVKILGGDGFDSPDLVKIGGDAVEGVFFSNHYSPEADNPTAKKFIDAYKAKYGAVPDALAALAYDAGLMLFGAIDRADSLDPAKIKAEVVKTKDLNAVSGKITLDAERNPVKPAVIITIEKGAQKFVTQVNP
jgi:branched-chain amino acid transport system substrate-binding protein